jgi:hypothetical protein
MLKIHTIQLTGNMSFIGLQARASVVAVGDDTDHSWGGGKIVSLEYDRKWNAVLVRKEKPFRHLGGILKPFDAAIIPWQHVQMARACDEQDVLAETLAPYSVETKQTNAASDDAKLNQPAKPIQAQGKAGGK